MVAIGTQICFRDLLYKAALLVSMWQCCKRRRENEVGRWCCVPVRFLRVLMIWVSDLAPHPHI